VFGLGEGQSEHRLQIKSKKRNSANKKPGPNPIGLLQLEESPLASAFAEHPKATPTAPKSPDGLLKIARRFNAGKECAKDAIRPARDG
jgi:hypothetical protein